MNQATLEYNFNSYVLLYISIITTPKHRKYNQELYVGQLSSTSKSSGGGGGFHSFSLTVRFEKGKTSTVG